MPVEHQTVLVFNWFSRHIHLTPLPVIIQPVESQAVLFWGHDRSVADALGLDKADLSRLLKVSRLFFQASLAMFQLRVTTGRVCPFICRPLTLNAAL